MRIAYEDGEVFEYVCCRCDEELHEHEVSFDEGNVAYCEHCYNDLIDEEELEGNYGYDSDSYGVCDHCGKSRKYGNCTCR
ncbi:hypothetical protein F6Y05_21525 [Bacillus megaterium]|nr:hypothetical protein [Priestia megaterium]